MKVKMKTHRGARKRFKLSRSGKVLRKKAFNRHLCSHKNGKRKRQLRKTMTVAKTEEKRIRQLIS